nr:PREDICTED: NFX1-type zinc finger-containing protein 1 [Anolis carolinensis]|eukprot:XP_016853733.1 PREDICTED: NFX1-type zinc finger-containing protein 1 [Anolis carolinensis]
MKTRLVEMLATYEEVAAELQELTFQEDLRILKGSRVIGMTTTGAAKYRKLLQSIRPQIVMVEEAAEILEAHVLTSLTPSCQHLILIGDHQQGMEKNVFFVQHREEESHSADSESYSNRHEAAFLASLTGYLIKQGYSRSQITVLTPYHGQVVSIRTLLRQKGMEEVAVHAVDDFQGEENDIVLLSLVRSNSQGKIGFLKDKNRLCVALSRAKKGFYGLGNLDALSAGSHLWKEISGLLKSKGLLGEELMLMCQNHPETKTAVKASEDFKALPDGGCALKCQVRLECGHPCKRRCHPLDQDHCRYRCTLPCSRVLCERKHKCPKKCEEKCGLCEVEVEKVIPTCGHSQAMPCHLPPEAWVCQEPCQKTLECGHLCKLKCGENCQVASCEETVQVTLPCSHVAETECFRKKMPLPCREKCSQKLDCGHICQGSCHECIAGRVHAACRRPCTRVLLCSHTCQGSCSENCPPCKKRCRNRCPHSRCNKTCGKFCFRCMQPCSWRCKHHQCTQMCWELCNRPRCDQPCEKTLRCKHPCVGLCGEPCPKKCRVCHWNELSEVFFGNEDEPESRFVVLKECGHTFEVRGLDRWMDGDGDGEAQAKPVQQKVCPKCSTPIQSNPRYSNVIKATQQRIADIKQKMYGTREQLQFGQAALLSELIVMSPCNRYFKKEALKREIEETASLQSLRDYESTVRLLFCLQRLRDRAMRCTEEQGRCLAGAAEALESWLHRRQRGDAFAAQQLRECRNEVKRLSYLANVFERLTICERKQMPSSSTARETADKALSLLTGPEPFTEAQEEALLPTLETLDRLMPASGPRLSQAEKVSIEEAMRFGRGQWYTCPNGHFYSVGQCGRPVEKSQCPECRTTIGGLKKKVHAGNVTASLTLETGNGGKEEEGRPLSSIGDLVGLSGLPISINATDHPPADLGSPLQANNSQSEASGQLPGFLVPEPSCPPYGPPLHQGAKGTTPGRSQQEGSGEAAMEETASFEPLKPDNTCFPETTSQDSYEPMEQDSPRSPQACNEPTIMDPLEPKEEYIPWSPQACTEPTTIDPLESKEGDNSSSPQACTESTTMDFLEPKEEYIPWSPQACTEPTTIDPLESKEGDNSSSPQACTESTTMDFLEPKEEYIPWSPQACTEPTTIDPLESKEGDNSSSPQACTESTTMDFLEPKEEYIPWSPRACTEPTAMDPLESKEGDNSSSPQACTEPTTMDPLEPKEEYIPWSPQACTEPTTIDPLESKEGDNSSSPQACTESTTMDFLEPKEEYIPWSPQACTEPTAMDPLESKEGDNSSSPQACTESTTMDFLEPKKEYIPWSPPACTEPTAIDPLESKEGDNSSSPQACTESTTMDFLEPKKEYIPWSPPACTEPTAIDPLESKEGDNSSSPQACTESTTTDFLEPKEEYIPWSHQACTEPTTVDSLEPKEEDNSSSPQACIEPTTTDSFEPKEEYIPWSPQVCIEPTTMDSLEFKEDDSPLSLHTCTEPTTVDSLEPKEQDSSLSPQSCTEPTTMDPLDVVVQPEPEIGPIQPVIVPAPTLSEDAGFEPDIQSEFGPEMQPESISVDSGTRDRMVASRHSEPHSSPLSRTVHQVPDGHSSLEENDVFDRREAIIHGRRERECLRRSKRLFLKHANK